MKFKKVSFAPNGDYSKAYDFFDVTMSEALAAAKEAGLNPLNDVKMKISFYYY